MKKSISVSVVLWLILSLIGLVNATTITVCPSGCDYNAIGLAIDAANDGDTVYVHNGTYNEHLRIKKSITLKGEGRNRVVVTGNDRGTCTYVTADNVSISGFTMENCGVGVLLAPSSNTNITNNTIQNTGRGIKLCCGSNNNLISGNIIQNNSDGISLTGSHKTTFISKNTITSNSRYGIYLIGNCYVTIIGNNISQNKEGIYIAGSSANISSNSISASTHGIYIVLDLSYINNVIFNNTIKSNGEGIHIKSRSTNNKISFNTFQHNQKYDIYLDESAYNHITSNKACNIYNTETNTILNNTCQREDSVTKITNTTLKTKQARDFINKTTKEGNITKTPKKEDAGLTILDYFLLSWFIITVFFGLILLWLGRGWRIREDEIMSINIMSIKTLLKLGLSTGILLRLYTITSILLIVFWVGWTGILTIDKILSHLDASNFVSGIYIIKLIGVLVIISAPVLILLYIVLCGSVYQKQKKVREREEEIRSQEEEERRFESKKKKVKGLEYNYIRNFVKKYIDKIYEYRHTLQDSYQIDFEEVETPPFMGDLSSIKDLRSAIGEIVENEKKKTYTFLDEIDLKKLEHPPALKKLRTVLSKKGIDFTESEIERLIDEELRRQEYEEFKDKILQRNPKDVGDCIRVFLDWYGENYSTSGLEYLQSLLSDKFGFVENLDWKVEDIKKEMELERFEKRLTEGSTERVTISEIDSISGYEFEGFLEKLFKKMGYSVTHTKLSGDQGGDLIISKFGDKIAVQAKRSENPIGNKAVQEVLGAMKMYNCNKGRVVTNNDFTTSARGLAIKSNVELVGRNKLKDWIKDYM
ncbi:MAG: restriction endonuclease [Candidatus Altiarchaeota archaeon]|nr:restriction endonuclease [Candidatus Altiarchaeota archaeon]